MDCDVAIVGCGPVGALLANLLGRRGVSVRVLEKQPQPYPLPRAIHFDGEAMRAFQNAGLAEQVVHHTHVGKGMLFQDETGRTLIDWSRDQVPGPMGWYESYRFHQPGLEAELVRGLDRFPQLTLTRGIAVETVAQDTDGATLALSDGSQVRAKFVVGCDGAQSTVRNGLDMGWTDLGFQERWLVVDVHLTRPRPDLGDYSIQHCHADYPATYVRGTQDRRRWEIRLTPNDPETPDDAQVWAKLSRWITPEDAHLERSAVYIFRSGVATQWQAGRVLLAGDAAHQMPPFMGQGMCAGVRDAANLAWKLALAVERDAPDLLTSYQGERDANVRQFIDLSMALGRLINQTDPEKLPKGQMKSIWPDLGPGLGPRDGVGGTLVPQGRSADGRLADDTAFPGFHILVRVDLPGATLPVIQDASGWLDERGLAGVVVRPDGYALAGFASADDLADAMEHVP
ncbi:MAG: bifunctional 3-(3-hydroxy-phenyl)propionate/3-hydroxycinnamic acid hydroxylase [Paracoccaceae bacterium]